MTERLYYTDSYRTEFDAAVRAVSEVDGRPALVLDRTCFYPTSGGQPYDTGTLAGLPVVDVVADAAAANGDIFHVVDGPADPVLAGQSVHGLIDWPRRFDHMQQHSGQHLISHVFQRLFGYETVSVHFGDQESTLDLDTAEVPSGELEQSERLANEMVFRAIPITAYFVSEAEIDSVPLRRPPKVSGEIRIVEIAGTDWSACGGTHVRTTAEIGPVKFVRQQRMRGQARVSFLCGQRALDDYARKHEIITAAAALYDTEIGQVPALIARDMDRLKGLQHEANELRTGQLAYVAEDLNRSAEPAGDFHIVTRTFDDLDANAVKTLANLLIEREGAIALLGSRQGGKATVIFARAENVPLHAGNLLRASLQEFGGGGGGRPDFAQGGGVSPERMPDLLAYAVTQARAEVGSESA
jgi:alanyl-tRNA synthetase